MNTKRFMFSLGLGMLICLIAAPLQAEVIVDDDFADGDFAKTGDLDTSWWTSSSSSGKAIAPGALTLVTGTSGRGIHTTFPSQTLANINDSIKVSYTFTTPATVGVNRSTSFRVGLFDNLGRLTENNPGVDPGDNRTDECCLDADTDASSSSPNAAYGWGVANAGPGTAILPGYMFDHDVNLDDATDDLNFRRHGVLDPALATITGTGRLMSTTSGFNNISPSGPDEDYQFLPETEYSGMFTIRRLSATEVSLTGQLTTPSDTYSYSNSDEFSSVDFSMLGFHVNSRTFGSSNSSSEPDNGIVFSNIKIETIVPEPSSMALLLGAFVAIPALRRR